MRKVGFGVLGIICFAGVWLYTQFQFDSRRDQIIFEENIISVGDSLAVMDQLLQKFPTNSKMVNYFIDRQGFLYLGAEKIDPLKGAINNPKVRKDKIFENFTDDEIDRFFNLIAYLQKNNIDAANLEKEIGMFLFNYRRTEENRFKEIREIMILRSSSDTLNSLFLEDFKILDQKSNLILIAPKKAQ